MVDSFPYEIICDLSSVRLSNDEDSAITYYDWTMLAVVEKNDILFSLLFIMFPFCLGNDEASGLLMVDKLSLKLV